MSKILKKIFTECLGYLSLSLFVLGISLAVYSESGRERLSTIPGIYGAENMFVFLDWLSGLAYISSFLLLVLLVFWAFVSAWFSGNEKEIEKENIVNQQLQAQIERAKKIGIEQAKPENAFWSSKSPGIYFDGRKIIIKTNYDPEIIKSIKGMHRRAWEPEIKA